jgi:Fur family ferric uptake transcriptional regulator
MASARHLAKQKFVEFLQRNRLRVTAQRRAIIESAFETEEHFTAEQLLQWSRRRDKTVSRATVYRTLPLLTGSGLVREIDLGGDSKIYDPNYAQHPHHSHIICRECNAIFEFDSKEIKKLAQEICRKMGFAVMSHRLQVVGSCNQLKRLGICPRKKL